MAHGYAGETPRGSLVWSSAEKDGRLLKSDGQSSDTENYSEKHNSEKMPVNGDNEITTPLCIPLPRTKTYNNSQPKVVSGESAYDDAKMRINDKGKYHKMDSDSEEK